MSLLDSCIQNRRSIRKYKEKIPDEKLIRQMIESASFAPSASHSQPVRFIRISSLEMKGILLKSISHSYENLRKSVESREQAKKLKIQIDVLWKYSKFMFNAPVLFAVGTDKIIKGLSKLVFDSNLVDENKVHFTSIDIALGLALQNFMLKSEELNIGTCILTTPFLLNPKIGNIFKLEDVNIKCFLTAGYADENPVLFTRKTVDEIYSKI